jgi:signal transduction histidine kinase
MLGHLADAAGIDFLEPQREEVVDIAAISRRLADDEDGRGRTTGVRGPSVVRVIGDEDYIERALRELIDNGHVHGEPPVRIIFEVDEDDVSATIADSGQGVPLTERKHVFEPFGRLDRSASMPGLGLGLTIARRLAEAMGGSIEITETPVGGGAFRLRLPRA